MPLETGGVAVGGRGPVGVQVDPEQAVPMLEKILQGTASPQLKSRALFVLALGAIFAGLLNVLLDGGVHRLPLRFRQRVIVLSMRQRVLFAIS